MMLPPAFEGEGEEMVYKFYSLAENQVLSVPKRAGGDDEEVPNDDAVCVGSSHGWLAYLNRSNADLFLSNPLSRRHLKLPSIRTSVIPGSLLDRISPGCGVEKLVISSPPDEDDCRAMMLTYCGNKLAFCCPRSPKSAWTLIADGLNRTYDDFVYSSRHQLFYCLLTDVVGDEELDHKFAACMKLRSLVEHDGDLFLVRRFVYEHMSLDGLSVDDIEDPYKTVDFEVLRYDREARMLRYLERSLEGLALFIGYGGYSFAIQAADFPELKPNSIYFTDSLHVVPGLGLGHITAYGGHDIGVFNYDKTFSPCYFPIDRPSILRRYEPAPCWFTPNPH